MRNQQQKKERQEKKGDGMSGSSPSSRPSSSVQTQRNYELLMKFQNNLPSRHNYSEPSANMKLLTRKIFGTGVKAIAGNKNGNLLALSYVFLVVSFRGGSGQRLKNALLEENLNLQDSFAELTQYPNESLIKNSKLQGLITYMIKNLHLHKPELGIFQLLDKFYVALELLSLYFRAILANLQYAQASSYSETLKTTEIYAILTEYFDLSCNATDHVYFFNDDGLFIASKDDKEFVFGRYYENETDLHENEKNIRRSTLEYIGELNNKNTGLRMSMDMALSISGFIFPNDDMPYFSSNAPTPEFGNCENPEKLQLKTSDKNTKPEAQQAESPPSLKLLGSFGNCDFQFRSDIIEQSQISNSNLHFEGQAETFGEEVSRQKGFPIGESLSLKDISYKKCDSERSKQERQNRQEVKSSMKFTVNNDQQNPENLLNPFENKQLTKNRTEKVLKTYTLTRSCFQDQPYSQKGLKVFQNISSPKSMFSCMCSEIKQSKISLQSKVVNLAYTPSTPNLNFKKKKRKSPDLNRKVSHKRLTLKKTDLLENLKGKEKGIQTCRSQNRINGFPKGKLPDFLKNRKKDASKSKSNDEKSNKSISVEKKYTKYVPLQKSSNMRSQPVLPHLYSESSRFPPPQILNSYSSFASLPTYSRRFHPPQEKSYIKHIFTHKKD